MAVTQRAVLVTGASGGIGSALAQALAQRGYLVFAGVRGDDGSLAAVPGVRVVTLDVTDPDSVAAAAKQVGREVRGLHAVVNNAGVIVQGPLELVPAEELRRQFEVNTFGPTYVMQAFLPLLRAGAGRLVNISAPTARTPLPFLAPISASKAALAALSEALRVELAAWHVPVVLVEPGSTATAIFAKADAAAQTALGAADPQRVALYRNQLTAVGKAMAKQQPRAIDPVVRAVVTAVDTRRPKRRYVVGSDARSLGMLSHLPAGLRDRLITSTFGLRGIHASSKVPA